MIILTGLQIIFLPLCLSFLLCHFKQYLNTAMNKILFICFAPASAGNNRLYILFNATGTRVGNGSEGIYSIYLH